MRGFTTRSTAKLRAFLSDLETLIHDGRFDTVQGFAVLMVQAAGSINWRRQNTSHPDRSRMMRVAGRACFQSGTQTAQDMTYFDYLNRLAPLVSFCGRSAFGRCRTHGKSVRSGSQCRNVHRETLDNLTVGRRGPGPILIYPFNRDVFRARFFRVPDSLHFFVFALLRNAVPPTPERAAELIAANRTLFERATTLGGKRYPFDSVPMTKTHWQQHYQPLWAPS
jgi:hypothetical protein